MQGEIKRQIYDALERHRDTLCMKRREETPRKETRHLKLCTPALQ